MLCRFVLTCFLVLPAASALALDEEAERYVHLALELTLHDRDYVDAYLGPPQWREAAEQAQRDLNAIAGDIGRLLEQLENHAPQSADRVRHRALLKNVRAMDTRARMALGETFDFATEAKLLYDVDLPDYDVAVFDQALQEIATLFPGDGTLAERVSAFRDGLAIPETSRDAVVERAITECRKRTLEHIVLPADEGFELEYVTGTSWGAYNWYQGGDISLLQINTDFPLKVDRVTSLGCHEGYPGHHVWNVLVENRLLKGEGWIEFSVFPLFSPFALMAEGSANYGVRLAFPGTQRLEFERDVLFPMAGLDPALAPRLDRLRKLTRTLGHARNKIAADYLDGRISREEAIEQRMKYGLVSREEAEKSTRFVEQYRSYVLNYTLGQDIVQAYIEKQGSDPASRWRAFEQMLTGLMTASDMRVP